MRLYNQESEWDDQVLQGKRCLHYRHAHAVKGLAEWGAVGGNSSARRKRQEIKGQVHQNPRPCSKWYDKRVKPPLSALPD